MPINAPFVGLAPVLPLVFQKFACAQTADRHGVHIGQRATVAVEIPA